MKQRRFASRILYTLLIGGFLVSCVTIPTSDQATTTPIDILSNPEYCPIAPHYPEAMQIYSDGGLSSVRKATFVSKQPMQVIIDWYQQAITMQGWRIEETYNAEQGFFAVYKYPANIYDPPATTFELKRSAGEANTTTYGITILLDHRHRNALWCPKLVP